MNKFVFRVMAFAMMLLCAFVGCGSDDAKGKGEESAPAPKPDPTPAVEVGLPLTGEDDGVIRAFPGAEGAGMYVTGGRGGRVIRVTTLADSGAGSLRAALAESGARTIVFDVAGTIELQKALEVKNGEVTIAGQTAPGDGICLRNYPVQVKTNNVIIRFLRFRLGDAHADDGDDTIWGRYCRDVILDHCSMSWCMDECASFYANKNFTMQWCLLAESLHNSGHSKGSHGYGGIWGGAPASFHHNVLAHHDSRNPRFDEPNAYNFHGLINGTEQDYVGTSGFSNADRKIDYRNNVVYNFCNYAGYGGEGAQVNFVNNYYKWGPASVNGLGKTISTNGTENADTGKKRAWFYTVDCAYTTGGVSYDSGAGSVYYAGNTLDTSVSNAATGDAVTADNAKGFPEGKTSAYRPDITWLGKPLDITTDATCHVTSHTAAQALTRTLAYAGASLSRDAVDKRVVDDIAKGKADVVQGSNGSRNGIVDKPSDTAVASAVFGKVAADGYPVLEATSEQENRAKADSDGDGIPDYYEQLLGLNANDKIDAAAKTLDPQKLYSNFEVYLHYLVRDITVRQVEGGQYGALK